MKYLFPVISEALIKGKVISPLSSLDEMSSMRSQYRHIIHRVMKGALAKMQHSVSTIATIKINIGQIFIPPSYNTSFF